MNCLSIFTLFLYGLFFTQAIQDKEEGKERNHFPRFSCSGAICSWLLSDPSFYSVFQKSAGHRLVRNCVPVITPPFETIIFYYFNRRSWNSSILKMTGSYLFLSCNFHLLNNCFKDLSCHFYLTPTYSLLIYYFHLYIYSKWKKSVIANFRDTKFYI